jgi:hypothetical protein
MKSKLLVFMLLVLCSSLSIVFIAVAQDDCPSSAENSRFGVVAHLSWAFLYDSEKIEQALSIMNAAGIRWVRVNWTWKDMQPEPGEFNFNQFDLVARLAAKHDIQLLAILIAVPAWASNAPPELIAERGSLSPVDKYRPREIEDWLNYIRQSIERYDGDGLNDAPGSPRIAYWEVWNEPNLRWSWPPEPDANEYLELLQATAETIRETDPTAHVVLGGISGSGVNAEGTGYLQQLYAADGADYFDVVSIHRYLYPVEADIAGLQAGLETTRQVMDANGDNEVPLWLTEIGWSDAPNAWGMPTVAQEDIANFLTQIYTAPFPVEKIFWYNFRNIFDQSTEVEHNFGLTYNNFTPKPAYNAYQQLATLCNDSEG